MYTLYNILGFIVIWVLVIVIAIFAYTNSYSDSPLRVGIITGIVGAVIAIIIMAFVGWYNTNTASGVRALKDNQSEFNNGLNREITITAEDGREIFHYEGKVDIETDHEDNYIIFESEDGKRYMIYYGVQDTVQIVEKQLGSLKASFFDFYKKIIYNIYVKRKKR